MYMHNPAQSDLASKRLVWRLRGVKSSSLAMRCMRVMGLYYKSWNLESTTYVATYVSLQKKFWEFAFSLLARHQISLTFLVATRAAVVHHLMALCCLITSTYAPTTTTCFAV
jgi:hypothetical protein